MVLYQLNRDQEALAIARRVSVKFSAEAEVSVALAAILLGTGDIPKATSAMLAVPPIQRQIYSDRTFLTSKVRWTPKLIKSALELGSLSLETSS